jgi:hypothetical protein
MGMTVIGMTGPKGASFAASCDLALITPSFATPRIQEGHIAMGHAWCELIEAALFERGAAANRRPGTPARRVPKAKVTPIRRATPAARKQGGGKRGR